VSGRIMTRSEWGTTTTLTTGDDHMRLFTSAQDAHPLQTPAIIITRYPNPFSPSYRFAHCRIFLSEKDFMSPRFNSGSTNDCRTYQPGKLIPAELSGRGDAVRVRVYGIRDVQGGLESRGKEVVRRNDNIRKARKVDRAAFLDDLRSGIVDSKAFAHVRQVDRGRAGDDQS